MIRYKYINNQILNIYSILPKITFPIDAKEIIDYFPNCRYMSYQQFAEINNCSIKDVMQVCSSKFGCSYYDASQNRYLILCNHSTKNNNNLGRQRWTCSHEIGHIMCNHHEILACEKLHDDDSIQANNLKYEAEADYFAATLLAPFPLFKLLNITSSIDIQNIFGLSCEASVYTYKHYLKWCHTRIKTSWENDLIKLYKQKNII